MSIVGWARKQIAFLFARIPAKDRINNITVLVIAIYSLWRTKNQIWDTISLQTKEKTANQSQEMNHQPIDSNFATTVFLLIRVSNMRGSR